MKSLVHRPFNYFNIYESVVLSKRGTRRQLLDGLKPVVQNRYQDYVQLLSTLHLLPIRTFVRDEQDALIHCYKSETKPLSKLKSEIQLAQPPDIGNLCQYCGVDTAYTYDHYLPKESFPEFSVLAMNLIPCCAKCNVDKGNNWTTGGHCSFFHLYFDSIPSFRFLYCTLNYTGAVPAVEYSILLPAAIDPQLQSRIISHYSNLGLLKKFAESSNTELTDVRSALREAKFASPQEVSRRLEGEMRAKISSRGPNHWKVALIDAMKNSPQFVQSCL